MKDHTERNCLKGGGEISVVDGTGTWAWPDSYFEDDDDFDNESGWELRMETTRVVSRQREQIGQRVKQILSALEATAIEGDCRSQRQTFIIVPCSYLQTFQIVDTDRCG